MKQELALASLSEEMSSNHLKKRRPSTQERKSRLLIESIFSTSTLRKGNLIILVLEIYKNAAAFDIFLF